MLEGADAHDEHRGVRSQAARAADEVDELLGPEVRAEACLRADDVPEAEGEAVREDGIVAVGDVREGPAVHEGGRPLQGLDQVRHQRVLQEDRRGPVDVEVAGADRMLLAVEGDHDPLEAGLEVRDALREAEDRHDLARGGDDEPVLPRHAVLRTAEARHDVPQLAVVHVEAPREQDAGRVDVELVPVEDVRVQDRRDQVVRRADGVDVPGEVEVDLLHRQDLGPPASRRAAFRPEDRPEGRLADGDDPLRAEAVQGLAEADRGQRLSLPVAGRGRAGDEDELALPTLSDSIDRRELDFRDEVALQDEVVPRQAEVLGDVDDRPHLRRLRDFDVRDHYRGNCKGAKRIFFPPSLRKWRERLVAICESRRARRHRHRDLGPHHRGGVAGRLEAVWSRARGRPPRLVDRWPLPCRRLFRSETTGLGSVDQTVRHFISKAPEISWSRFIGPKSRRPSFSSTPITRASSIGVRFKIGERYGYDDTSTPRASGLKAGRTRSGSVTRNAGTLTVAPRSSFNFTAGCSWPMMIGWSVETSSCPWTSVYPPMSARLSSGRWRSPRIVAR